MIRQDRAAGQLGDDRRVDAGELRVIHEEPGFSRPAHDRGLDSRFLGVRCRESCVQRHAVCPQECFREVVLLQAVEGRSAEELREQLTAGLAEAQVDLSVLVRPAIEGQWGKDLKCDPFVVTADGPDKPGLIAAMSRVFARHGVNIESLKAILGEGGEDHALFVFEAMVPEDADLGRLRRELACEGQSRHLRVSVQHRDIFEAVHRVSSF